MVVMGSFSPSPLPLTAAKSNMRFPRDGRRYVLGGRDRLGGDGWRIRARAAGKKWLVVGSGESGRFGQRFGDGCLWCLHFACRVQRATGRAFRSRTRRQDSLFILDFQIRDLLFNLGLELVRRPLELVHVLSHLAGNLRQLLGPKDDEGQEEQE